MVGALASSCRFPIESSGFVRTASDGLNQLDSAHQLVNRYQSANDGNVVQTALVPQLPGRPFTVALGFGPTAAAAIDTAQRSAGEDFDSALTAYVNGWRAYDGGLHAPPSALAGFSPAQKAAMRRMYWLSANVVKAAEDKTYTGAFVASPPTPGVRRFRPLRRTPAGPIARCSPATPTRPSPDPADGDRTSARDMVAFLFDRAQQPDGSFPRDSLINGAVAPDTFGLSEIDRSPIRC